MNTKLNGDTDSSRERRRLGTQIKASLRQLSNQVSLLNHQVSARVEMKDIDLDCLDLLSQAGPMSPSELARRAGLHPATMTGILDRLERGGWVVRGRDATDRRAVVVTPTRERNVELFELYSGMNGSMDEIIEGYDREQLTLLADFLRRSTLAGRDATEALAASADETRGGATTT
jgi:DNA-binding MarR family transcriptional regulator